MSYSDLLKDPRWQKKRLQVLERDNWTCRSCEATDKTLHVHHTHYVKGRKPWEYDDADLKSLCVDCHGETTDLTAELAKIAGGMNPWDLRQMLGYARSLERSYAVTEEPLPAGSAEELAGIMDSFCVNSYTVDRWLTHVAMQNGGLLPHEVVFHLAKISLNHREYIAARPRSADIPDDSGGG